MLDWLVLFAAQGFGIGKVAKAPGTFGTLVGIPWVLTLIDFGNFWLFWFGCIAGLAGAVYACDRAEHILDQQDPPSVVLDEIAAFPICFLGETLRWFHLGHWPTWRFALNSHFILATVIAFGLFRLFDIWKPGPIRSSQRLRGGWGVVVDDLLAALVVGLIMIGFAFL